MGYEEYLTPQTQEEIWNALEPLLLVCAVNVMISLVVGIAVYIMRAIGLKRMSRKLGIEHAWISFVPILWVLQFGAVSQKYVKQNGQKGADFGPLLLILRLLSGAGGIGMLFYLLRTVMPFLLNAALIGEPEIIESQDRMISVIIGLFGFYLMLMVVSVLYAVFYNISLWRIYAIFSYSSATPYLIVSIFFGIAAPIFLLILCKNQPACTYEERLGIPILKDHP